MNDWLIHTNINVFSYTEKLEKIIKKTRAIDLENVSTRGLNSKQYMLFEYKEEFIDIQKKVKKEIKKHIYKDKNLNLLSAWTIKGDEDSYHTAHKHNENTNHIATVLYLEVSEQTMHKPGLFYYFLQDNKKLIYKEIKPIKGSLIIMPIHIFHGCYPQSKGLRQTLNMDFEIRD